MGPINGHVNGFKVYCFTFGMFFLETIMWFHYGQSAPVQPASDAINIIIRTFNVILIKMTFHFLLLHCVSHCNIHHTITFSLVDIVVVEACDNAKGVFTFYDALEKRIFPISL